MSRTDQTKLCCRCAGRFADLSCPKCGNQELLDLSRLDQRKRALEWLLGRASTPATTHAPLRGLILPLSGTLVMAAIGGATGMIAPWLAAAFCGCIGVWRLVESAHPSEQPLQLSPNPTSAQLVAVLPSAGSEPAPERVMRLGIAHAAAPLTAPLTGQPCIAFRVVGRAGRFAVDDAAVAPFELVTPEGSRVAVLASASQLELAVETSDASDGALERLEAFLDDRGLDLESTGIGIVVTEGVLRNGEEVVVEGLLEGSSSDYRRAGTEALIGRTDQPVTIRRARV